MKASKVAKLFTDELATDFFEVLKSTRLRHLTVNSIDWEVSDDHSTSKIFFSSDTGLTLLFS